MFASIYGRTIPKCEFQGDAGQGLLVDLAFTFSPLVEQTTADTVVLDVAGQDLLFGSPANPNAAIHSARSFKGVTVIPAGRESLQLGSLPLKRLDYSLADIEKERVAEISETLE